MTRDEIEKQAAVYLESRCDRSDAVRFAVAVLEASDAEIDDLRAKLALLDEWEKRAAQCLATLDERNGAITDLRAKLAEAQKKLAWAGAEGSPPPGQQGVIQELRTRLAAAEQRAREYKIACEAKDAALDIKDAEIVRLRKGEKGEG